MRCYDCSPDDPGTAVAVCVHCGAGLCREHLHCDSEDVHQVIGTGTAEPTTPARRLTCTVCHAAEHQDTARPPS